MAGFFVNWKYKVSIIEYNQTHLEVTKHNKHTAGRSSNERPFLMNGSLVYWIYKVSKVGYDQTKLEVTMYHKYNAHIGLNVTRCTETIN